MFRPCMHNFTSKIILYISTLKTNWLDLKLNIFTYPSEDPTASNSPKKMNYLLVNIALEFQINNLNDEYKPSTWQQVIYSAGRCSGTGSNSWMLDTFRCCAFCHFTQALYMVSHILLLYLSLS